MATTLPQAERNAASREVDVWADEILPAIKWVLAPISSLRLTVVLFALSIFLVLAGTFAQVNMDIWEVIRSYFRTFVALIPVSVFFPHSFFPTWHAGLPDLRESTAWIPFPGGWTIGTLLVLNLLAAHLVRFQRQARGRQLQIGLAVIVLGSLITWVVIASGSNKEGIQGHPWIGWAALWNVFLGGLVVAWCGSIAGLVLTDNSKKAERGLLWAATVLLGGVVVFLAVSGIVFGESARLGESSMRILWQLIKGGFAGVVLLIGCWMVFKKRAGIVLLHSGVGLMMLGEVVVGLWAVETQMSIEEGQTVNYVQDIRVTELAIIDSSGEQDEVVAVPQSILQSSEKRGPIDHEYLPFQLQLVKYVPNTARVRQKKPGETNPATLGVGVDAMLEEARAGTGTDSSGEVDMASAFVRLINKRGKDIGTVLVSQRLLPEEVEVDGKQYKLELRFKHTYKPYSMHLKDVSKSDYIGTSTPRDYSSRVLLIDPTRDEEREVRIWMNNPLRFAGETFYQSSYHPAMMGRREATTLSVVTNTGWMIPYVSCMLVMVGMMFHFGVTLMRFLNRRASGPAAAPGGKEAPPAIEISKPRRRKDRKQAGSGKNDDNDPHPGRRSGTPTPTQVGPIVFAVLVAGAAGIFLLNKAQTPAPKSEVMDLYAFGKIPVAYQGRVKPIDTLARNSLRIISARQTFNQTMDARMLKEHWSQVLPKIQQHWPKLADDQELAEFEGPTWALIELLETKTDERKSEVSAFIYQTASIRGQPAVLWLLEFMGRPDRFPDHAVFRIENLEVLDLLGLRRREGFRYAFREFIEKLPVLTEQAEKSRKKVPKEQTLFDKKILELERKIGQVDLLLQSLHPPDVRFETPEMAMRDVARAYGRRSVLAQRNPPLLVPPFEDSTESIYSVAWIEDLLNQARKQERDAHFTGLKAIIDAYTAHNQLDPHTREVLNTVPRFNAAVKKYWNHLAKPDSQAAHDFGPAAAEEVVDPLAESGRAQALHEEVNLRKLNVESHFNHFDPFWWGWILYLLAFVLTVFGFMGWARGFNLAAFSLISLVFAVHTVALVVRMYLSGRPPVTNLYSSAVFIGWASVAFGIILEKVFRLGVGNLLASAAGFSTLLIAYFLAGDGDTMVVMQAVLDTQFWLSTHVVCITLGYTATFAAGGLALTYVVLGMLTPKLTAEKDKTIIRMIYGSLCFAIFFSFVGTVLGGLWADDSWGRFWGWDPKENGALIIVLWNALVLHARWGNMVKDRGLALLAVAGNITTAWSWFGVNELGVGLHAYGFTEGVLRALGIFVVSQLLVIAAGSLPLACWWSHRRRSSDLAGKKETTVS